MAMSDGYFTDGSMLRRVHSERAVAFSGPRALLMQAAHPVAFAGFFAATGALDAPYERLRRTAEVMSTIGFGTRVDADRATRRVRAMHKRVRGVLDEPVGRFPAGTPYAADDPCCCCGSWRRWPTRRCWSTTASSRRSAPTSAPATGATTA